ncbi:MAG: acyl-CoA thioesterase [Paracoccaceae bacterium]
MYPIFRMAKEMVIHRRKPKLDALGTHVSHHMCWPWDLDLWMELNNGRTLTLFDLGRLPLAQRIGLGQVLLQNKWGMTVAGVSVRYRKRIRVFETVQMRSRSVGWDDRFIYLDQSMWNRAGDCTTQGLFRMAVTGKNGIISPDQVAHEMGYDQARPELPNWVNAWVKADAQRPWPPTNP